MLQNIFEALKDSRAQGLPPSLVQFSRTAL